MPTTTWIAAPGGVYRNRYLSDRLLMQAVGQCKLLALTQVPDQEFTAKAFGPLGSNPELITR